VKLTFAAGDASVDGEAAVVDGEGATVDADGGAELQAVIVIIARAARTQSGFILSISPPMPS
jgi:hypothetical protein